MRISDWSSDVCSSDLNRHRLVLAPALRRLADHRHHVLAEVLGDVAIEGGVRIIKLVAHGWWSFWERAVAAEVTACADRKSVGEGKSMSVRVAFGGRSVIKTKKNIPC